MAEKRISALVEGGKATAGPPIGPALGPLGVSAGKVVAEINEKTKGFAGMTVPVNIIVDTDTKEYRIEVGTPPTSALIKKAIGVEKGSRRPKEEIIADLLIDEVIQIAKSKQEVSHGKDLKDIVNEVLGTCLSLGVTVEGKNPKEVQKEVKEGKYDEKIKGITPLKELSPEEKQKRAQKARQMTEKKEEAPKKGKGKK